jgi:hypothetical protein
MLLHTKVIQGRLWTVDGDTFDKYNWAWLQLPGDSGFYWAYKDDNGRNIACPRQVKTMIGVMKRIFVNWIDPPC